MRRLPLKDALFLGFCAVLILVAKAGLRFHLKIPGHSMLLTLFFLLVAAGCVKHKMAATFTGLMVGIMATLLGMGKGGPLIILKYLLPALVVDGMSAMFGAVLFKSVLLCILTAVLAAGTRFVSAVIVNMLVGMDFSVTVQYAGLQAIGNMVFGAIGSLGVPTVIRKLKAFGVI